ncbi:DUF4214 domain-containing protein [Methylobacterium sp. 174MFSha1.1]|uniref:DUF4214 domain-containing protein n=1 Tax=Methylobacterium sp. 174MFSha1.1 TaxID=1502749 RepID=UPI000B8561DC|nr:DUF4214 domain-containing protein [Methylobacterium sp. 174MFSha1.1]
MDDAMLCGKLTVVHGGVRLLGWACDTNKPSHPLTIAVTSEGKMVARAVANQHSNEILQFGAPHAWCSFNALLAIEIKEGFEPYLTLRDYQTSRVLDGMKPILKADLPPSEIANIDDLVHSDPTTLRDIAELSTCGAIFEEFVRSEGEESFVAAAYVYILGRPADAGGLKSYSSRLREKKVTSYDLLRALANSNEFKSKPRLLSSPASSGFPFR